MYLEFFSFAQKPFEITPDTRFLFLSRQHEEAIEHLLYGIRERRGFLVLTGEVGTGKTTMLECLRDLYAGRHEAIKAVVLKDLYELLEKVFDRCRDAGNVVFHIVLKHT